MVILLGFMSIASLIQASQTDSDAPTLNELENSTFAGMEDGNVILEVLQAGKNDAVCCPTMLATRTWSLQGSQLQEGEIEETGKLSLDMLEGRRHIF